MSDVCTVFLTEEELKDLGLPADALVERKAIPLPTKSADELMEWAKHAEEAERE